MYTDVLFFGSETWVLRRNEEKQLQRTKIRFAEMDTGNIREKREREKKKRERKKEKEIPQIKKIEVK